MRNARWFLIGLGAAVLVGLFILMRPGSEEPAGLTSPSPTPTATADTPTPEPTGTEPSAEPTSTPSLDAVEIEVEEGRVEGPRTVSVALGETVSIEVESDAADTIHVHGYDLFFQVSPDRRTPILFDATIPGIFEIELEGSGVLLTRLEVT